MTKQNNFELSMSLRHHFNSRTSKYIVKSLKFLIHHICTVQNEGICFILRFLLRIYRVIFQTTYEISEKYNTICYKLCQTRQYRKKIKGERNRLICFRCCNIIHSLGQEQPSPNHCKETKSGF